MFIKLCFYLVLNFKHSSPPIFKTNDRQPKKERFFVPMMIMIIIKMVVMKHDESIPENNSTFLQKITSLTHFPKQNIHAYVVHTLYISDYY